MITLRPYQNNLIGETRSNMLIGNKSILIQAPCGSGKTLLTAEMLRLSSIKGKRAWFIVHRRELLKQSIMAFDQVGLKVGIVASGFPMAKRMPVQVCSIQTLARRYKDLPAPDLIIYDECHHLGAKSWSTIYDRYQNSFHIGLTATPWRLDGKGLRCYFKKMIQGPSVEWLIENGFLSKYRIYAPSKVDTNGLHTRTGDYVKSELALAIDKPSITGDAIKHYIKLCSGKRAIVFCVSIEHSKHVVEQFNANGISAEHVDGETPREQRDAAIKRFISGRTLILSNVELFGEGFDVPATEASILLRPTKSLSMHIQQVGRALRIFEGKEQAIILDHAGNTLVHGLPDDDHQWSLDGVDKTNKNNADNGPSVKVCPKCFAAQESGSKSCKFCGVVFEVKYRKVDHVDGELTEIDIVAARRKRLVEQGSCKDFDALVALGKRKNYKRPYLWARYVMRSRKQKEEAKSGR